MKLMVKHCNNAAFFITLYLLYIQSAGQDCHSTCAPTKCYGVTSNDCTKCKDNKFLNISEKNVFIGNCIDRNQCVSNLLTHFINENIMQCGKCHSYCMKGC